PQLSLKPFHTRSQRALRVHLGLDICARLVAFSGQLGNIPLALHGQCFKPGPRRALGLRLRQVRSYFRNLTRPFRQPGLQPRALRLSRASTQNEPNHNARKNRNRCKHQRQHQNLSQNCTMGLLYAFSLRLPTQNPRRAPLANCSLLPVAYSLLFKALYPISAFTRPTPPGRLEISGFSASHGCPSCLTLLPPGMVGFAGVERFVSRPPEVPLSSESSSRRHAWPLKKR